MSFEKHHIVLKQIQIILFFMFLLGSASKKDRILTVQNQLMYQKLENMKDSKIYPKYRHLITKNVKEIDGQMGEKILEWTSGKGSFIVWQKCILRSCCNTAWKIDKSGKFLNGVSFGSC